MTVFIVVEGEDYRDANVQEVFGTFANAELYVTNKYPTYKKKKTDDHWVDPKDSSRWVLIETWEVEP